MAFKKPKGNLLDSQRAPFENQTYVIENRKQKLEEYNNMQERNCLDIRFQIKITIFAV